MMPEQHDDQALDATARWGREWQAGDDWSSHTVMRAEADRIAAGYLAFLRRAGAFRDQRRIAGVGIGSGAGYLEAALAARGIDMTASEWSEEGVRLIRSQNPELPCARIDLTTFSDRSRWDLILCRELYPFTRVDAFSGQMALISRLIDALRPGGVVLMVGSDINRPQCLDYERMVRELRADRRVSRISGPILEPVLKRMPESAWAMGAGRPLNALAECALWTVNLIRRPRLAAIRVYAIHAAG